MIKIIDPVIYPVKVYLAVVERGKPQHYPGFTFVKANVIVSASVSDAFPAYVYDELAVNVDTDELGVVMAMSVDAEHCVVAHECYHACEEIFKYISKDSPVTGEPMAYLMQFLFKEVTNTLKNIRNERIYL